MRRPMLISSRQGYTLIEILIVMLIISIVGVTALLTVSGNKNTQQKEFARELANLLTLAEQQAMLQPAVLGMVFSKNSLQFYRYTTLDKKPVWQPLEEPAVLGMRKLPKNMTIHLKIDNQPFPPYEPASNNPPVPHLIITSSGGLTAFVISIGDGKSPPRYQLIGNDDGSINVENATDAQ